MKHEPGKAHLGTKFDGTLASIIRPERQEGTKVYDKVSDTQDTDRGQPTGDTLSTVARILKNPLAHGDEHVSRMWGDRRDEDWGAECGNKSGIDGQKSGMVKPGHRGNPTEKANNSNGGTESTERNTERVGSRPSK